MDQAGYRDGIVAGKESQLQAGFDQGYATFGVPHGRALGQARGQLSTLLHVLKSQPNAAALLEEAQELNRDLNLLSMDDVCPKDFEAEKHFREEHGEVLPDSTSLTARLDASFSGSLGQKEKADWQQCLGRLNQLWSKVDMLQQQQS